MNLAEIQGILDAEVLTGKVDFNTEVGMVMASDLMSDVLSFCCSGALLVTGLTNSQTIRTAEVADLCAIVFARGKQTTEETIRLARERGIPLFTTELPMYEACGILFSNGLRGIKDTKAVDGP